MTPEQLLRIIRNRLRKEAMRNGGNTYVCDEVVEEIELFLDKPEFVEQVFTIAFGTDAQCCGYTYGEVLDRLNALKGEGRAGHYETLAVKETLGVLSKAHKTLGSKRAMRREVRDRLAKQIAKAKDDLLDSFPSLDKEENE